MTDFQDLFVISTSLILLLGAIAVLVIDILFPNRRGWLSITALGSLIIAIACTLLQFSFGDIQIAFHGAVVLDQFALFFIALLIIAAAIITVASSSWALKLDLAGEYYALLLIATGSMALLVQAQDLILIFIALETTSIAQYVLVAITRDDKSAEAGLKYLISGAIAAAIMIYGFALLFGLSGSTSLADISAFVNSSNSDIRLAITIAFVFIIAGFGFKMALVPFHGWAPDVYQGAPTRVSAFLSVASKAAGFAIALRIFYTGLGGGDTFISSDWAMVFGAFAVLSMIVGNTAALLQTDARRLLGYSSIAQAGNIAIGIAAVTVGNTVGASGVLFYLASYLVTNLAAFLTVIIISERIGSYEIKDYAGIIRRSPLLSLVLILSLLSLTGIPPTAGFIAKLYIFNNAIQTGEIWLVVVVVIGVVNTAIAAFYYLRWVRIIALDPPDEDQKYTFVTSGRMQFVLVFTTIGMILIGLAPSWLIDVAQNAASTLL